MPDHPPDDLRYPGGRQDTVRPRRCRWPWVAGLLAALVVAVFVAVSIVGLVEYAGHDHVDLIDRPDVVDRVQGACDRMQSELAAHPAASPGTVGAVVAEVRAEDAAVTAMVADVRAMGADALDDDIPSRDWLADWETMVRLREDWADAAAAGTPHQLVVPRSEGHPITERMAGVGVDCPLPPGFTSPGTAAR